MSYLPTREAELVTWSNNFNARLVGGGIGAYGLTAAQVAAYTTLHNAWISAYNAANAGPTRGPATIETKNTAKENLINGTNGIRELVGIIQHNPATTNTDREELFITVPDLEPTPIPVPTVAPGVDIVSSVGRTVTVRLYDPLFPDSRGKPAGVKGASLYSFVGEEQPDDIEQWKYEGSTTKSTIEVDFPTSVAGGSKVWFTAYWFNPRIESGPPSNPVSVNIPGGLAQAA